MESSVQAWYRGLRMMGIVAVLLLAGCAAHNPLLGRWVFERYAGGGDIGSVLGGFASTISKGTIVEFRSNAMIVSQGGQASSTPIDHYDIKGNKITVWTKTSPTLIQGQTYIVSADGREISSEIAGSGMREIFQRVPAS